MRRDLQNAVPGTPPSARRGATAGAGHAPAGTDRRASRRPQRKSLAPGARPRAGDRQEPAVRHDLDLLAGHARQVDGDEHFRIALPHGYGRAPRRGGPTVNLDLVQRRKQPIELSLDVGRVFLGGDRQMSSAFGASRPVTARYRCSSRPVLSSIAGNPAICSDSIIVLLLADLFLFVVWVPFIVPVSVKRGEAWRPAPHDLDRVSSQ